MPAMEWILSIIEMLAHLTRTELVVMFLASKGVVGLMALVSIGVRPIREQIGLVLGGPQTDPSRLLGP
jgi:hypothetical protein